MTTEATALREAICARLGAAPFAFAKVRKTPVAQLQPDDLPAVTVLISSERLSPDGDANAGEPRFISDVTISISVVRGFDDPSVLAGTIDADVDAIESGFLCDPTFVDLFEGVTAITRRRLYPQSGETYFAELRLDMTFETRVSFNPVVTDDYAGASLTVRPLLHPAAPPIDVHIDPPQED